MSESYEPSSNELTREQEDDHGLGNALAWFQSIKEMVDDLRESDELAGPRDGRGADDIREAAEDRIRESVLSVEVRSGWETVEGYFAGRGLASPPVSSVPAPAEFRILLTTGGPACQLVGELNEHGEPESARLEHQDWGTPWTPVRTWDLANIVDPEWAENPILAGQSSAYDKADSYLLTFASQFYFGEG